MAGFLLLHQYKRRLCRVGKWRFCGVATSHGCAITRDCYCFLVLIILLGIFCSRQSQILNSSPLRRLATPSPNVFLKGFSFRFYRDIWPNFFTLQKKLPERLFRWSVRRKVLFTELRIFWRRRRRRVDETRRHLQTDAEEKGAGSQFCEFGMKSFATSLDLESLLCSKLVTELERTRLLSNGSARLPKWKEIANICHFVKVVIS